jgi:hypothetical protein
MGSAVREIEEEYAENLESWDGDIDKLSGTEDTLDTIIGITEGVTRDMIEDYLSMQEVRMRSSSEEFKGFLEAKTNINNYASKDITDVILGLDYNKSKLKLVKVFPGYKHDSFKVSVDEIRGYNDLEIKLYFEVLEKKNIGLNLRLDYTNPRGEGSQVSSTPCDSLNFKTSVKKPKLEDLDFEEEAEIPVSKVEKAETIETDLGEVEVLESVVEDVDAEIEEAPAFETVEEEPQAEEEVEDEIEEEKEEPVDLGESGMDDLLGKLDEFGSDKPPEVKQAEESEGKDSDEKKGMDDLLGKLDELDSDDPPMEKETKKSKKKDSSDDEGMDDLLGKLDEL